MTQLQYPNLSNMPKTDYKKAPPPSQKFRAMHETVKFKIKGNQVFKNLVYEIWSIVWDANDLIHTAGHQYYTVLA